MDRVLEQRPTSVSSGDPGAVSLVQVLGVPAPGLPLGPTGSSLPCLDRGVAVLVVGVRVHRPALDAEW